MDTVLLALSALATAMLGWLGFRVSVRPLAKEEVLRYELAFVVLALIAVGLLIWGGVRSSVAQDRLRDAVAEASSAATKANTAASEANLAASSANTEAAAAHAGARKAKEEAQASRKELAEAKASINANVGRYRTDTSTQVAKVLRPPRELDSTQRALLIKLLREVGPHEIGVRHALGSDEAEGFSKILAAAIAEAGWSLKPLQRLRFLIWGDQGRGLYVMSSSASGDPAKLADEVTSALSAIGMPPSGRLIAEIEEGVELYVALQ